MLSWFAQALSGFVDSVDRLFAHNQTIAHLYIQPSILLFIKRKASVRKLDYFSALAFRLSNADKHDEN